MFQGAYFVVLSLIGRMRWSHANAVTWPLDAHIARVLDWLRFTFNRKCSEWMIRRFGRHARESYTEAILLEFDLIAGSKEARGFHFRH